MNACHRNFAEIASREMGLTGPILEIGSYLVSGQEQIANMRGLFPGSLYIGADMRQGPGVDLVMDAEHQKQTLNGQFSTVLCLSTLEHIARPWQVIRNVYDWLTPGGVLVMTSVFRFPVHNYPDDYWRFTESAFRVLLEAFPVVRVACSGPKHTPHTIAAMACKKEQNIPEDLDRALMAWKKRHHHPKPLLRRIYRAVREVM